MSKVVMTPQERVEFDIDKFLNATQKFGITRCTCQMCNEPLAVHQVMDDDEEVVYIMFFCVNCQKHQPYILMNTDAVILADTDEDEDI